MSAAYPKVSFLVPRPALDKVQAFAALHGMKMSEALRFVIDVGLENLASVEPPVAAVKIEPAKHEPTRGKFPRPTGGSP
jgi:hypothetical protein